MRYDFLIIGGGLVGLATAMALKKRHPRASLAVLEKENRWGAHQSSRNSGVIHAGVYYKPGSLKARFALEGNASMLAFCKAQGIPHEQCGKVIVATTEEELPGLHDLHARSLQNGLDTRLISREETLELEPHVNCVAALHVPSTGIVDFARVAQKYADLLAETGVDLFLDFQVRSLKETGQGYIVTNGEQVFETHHLISTSGLYSDKLARAAGVDPGMKIVPFRGEYWHLSEEKAHLVKNLIYPVPNPKFPFLGVHMTRLIDGSIHAGPNAVLALAREGYTWKDIHPQEAFETFGYPGFWKLAKTYLGEGMKEMYRSVNKAAFVRSVQRLIPEIEAADLHRGDAGVRAQALRADGSLVDDFHILANRHGTFVLNAPSPAATASLAIGDYVCGEISASI